MFFAINRFFGVKGMPDANAVKIIRLVGRNLRSSRGEGLS